MIISGKGCHCASFKIGLLLYPQLLYYLQISHDKSFSMRHQGLFCLLFALAKSSYCISFPLSSFGQMPGNSWKLSRLLYESSVHLNWNIKCQLTKSVLYGPFRIMFLQCACSDVANLLFKPCYALNLCILHSINRKLTKFQIDDLDFLNQIGVDPEKVNL